MSEVEAEAPPPPAEIVPSKSEDKLEIEKEEEQDKQKAEDIVGEMFSDDKKEEGKSDETSEKPAESTSEDTDKPAESTSEEKSEAKAAEPSEEKAEEVTEKQETLKTETEKDEEKKDKKFNINIPKIKTPKVIKEIRSRSKSREKKKNKDGDNDGEGEKKEEAEASGESPSTEEKKEEGDEKKEEGEEKKDLVKEAKTKVKDAMENINIPKMPKLHRPGFMKKKSKEGEKTEGEKAEGEKTEEENAGEGEVKEGEKEEKPETEEKTGDDKPADEGEKADEEKKEEEKTDEEKKEEKTEDKKSSIIDSLKSIKSQVFSKSKKTEASETDGGEKSEEAEKLLEEKPEEKTEETKEEEKEPKEKKENKGSSILKSIRNVASGVPALFKKDSPKDSDVEAGEKDELLENKEEEKDNKTDDLKMEEIKLEEDKKEDGDDKKDDEKKDPEKGDVVEEKSPLDRIKKLPSEAVHQFTSLDRQRQYGLLGILGGLLFLVLVIVIAACAPGGWQNHHKLVEGGAWVETQTGCGPVRGEVAGDSMFLFRGVPYSAAVARFEHSRLAATLEECGAAPAPANQSRVCMRRTAAGLIGEEDCLTLDIATSSVVYDSPAPVVAYIPGADPALVPGPELALEQGVVVVTVQVRQGLLGYLAHPALSATERPPTSGNYALGDLVTALRWVQLNIRHFGGDPGQVTLLGHQQGASLATGLTMVAEARSLYHRVWITGGAGSLDTLTLEAAEAQFDAAVRKVCADPDRDCLVNAEASALLDAVDEEVEPWSYADLPTREERAMPTYLIRDTRMVRNTLDTTMRNNPLTVPIVIGVAAQAEANADNYALLDWNNTDTVDSEIENRLGRFDVSLSAAAMKQYNVSCNWSKYISMVSDIRTVCPLNNLAVNFTKLYSDSFVSFYISTEGNPADTNGSGHVADSTTDISAILGLPMGEEKIGANIKRKFYQFVKGYIQKLVPDVVVFGKTNTKFSDAKCKIWQNGTDSLVPRFGRKF